jgi:membrane-bound metal-dependent hydrolase YbcI (DUF457 family)
MIGVVWLDILHSSLVLIGPEKAAVVPGITAVVPMDLIHYPYSHSLVASILWSLLTFVLYRSLWATGSPQERTRIGAWMAVTVFSHFVLDLVAHRPDLPLLWGPPKFGFGLWNSMVGTFALENLFVFGGLWLFLRRFERKSWAERYGLLVLSIVGSAMFFTFPLGHFPDDVRYVEAFALAVYAVIPVVALKCQPQKLLSDQLVEGAPQGAHG